MVTGYVIIYSVPELDYTGGCFPFTLSLRKKGGYVYGYCYSSITIIILVLINEIIKNIYKK